MTPQELKNSILQLAIQGKLVEQRPEEGTAEELYRQIQQEKQKLIKEGKIKKEKPLPEITEEEKATFRSRAERNAINDGFSRAEVVFITDPLELEGVL